MADPLSKIRLNNLKKHCIQTYWVTMKVSALYPLWCICFGNTFECTHTILSDISDLSDAALEMLRMAARFN